MTEVSSNSYKCASEGTEALSSYSNNFPFPFQRYVAEETSPSVRTQASEQKIPDQSELRKIRTAEVTLQSKQKARIGVVLGDEDLASETTKGIRR